MSWTGWGIFWSLVLFAAAHLAANLVSEHIRAAKRRSRGIETFYLETNDKALTDHLRDAVMAYARSNHDADLMLRQEPGEPIKPYPLHEERPPQ